MSEDPEELIPYDLTAEPKVHVLLSPGWEERLKELTPRNAPAVHEEQAPDPLAALGDSVALGFGDGIASAIRSAFGEQA